MLSHVIHKLPAYPNTFGSVWSNSLVARLNDTTRLRMNRAQDVAAQAGGGGGSKM